SRRRHTRFSRDWSSDVCSSDSNLLQSPPDEFSPLTGKELVEQKVQRLVSMAGKFPSGREFNIHEDVKAAKQVVEHWPTQVIFSGWEIGEKIRPGLPLIHNRSEE